ncbi:MAG: hypothetical protein ACLFVO_05935 [Chloroflexaceae bacterium]
MHNQSANLIEEAWVLAFRLAWAAAVASGRRYERLMYAHGHALRRWLRRKRRFGHIPNKPRQGHTVRGRANRTLQKYST